MVKKSRLKNDRFSIEDLPFETRTEWARQRSSYGSATMLIELLGCKCTPMEGGNVNGDNDVWSLGFRDERSGLGYQIHYWLTVHDDDENYCDIEDVEIVRDERWDAKAETAPESSSSKEPDYKHAYKMLTGFLARKRAEELQRGTGSAAERAWAYELAYAYAEGVAESQGVRLPELI